MASLSRQAKKDLEYLDKKDPKKAAKVRALIEETDKNPRLGNNAHPLQGKLKGVWAKDISGRTDPDRLGYKPTRPEVEVTNARGHYKNW